VKLLLASSSAARRQMLAATGIPFDPVATTLDEERAKAALAVVALSPRETADRLAEMKAGGVENAGDALVLGADQVLEREDGAMLGKPDSREQAADQLRAMAGRVHHLHSAAVILERGKRVWSGTETATLRMRPLSDAFIEHYLDAEYEAVRWNVGAYRIEGRGAQLFETVEGSHFAVLGLPLLPLISYLRARGMLPG